MQTSINHPLFLQAIPEISAIYFALLQCGYDYHTVGRSQDYPTLLAPFAGTAAVPSFFAEVRQTTCEPYPYWPRAAILETATFFLAADQCDFADFDGLCAQINAAGNIADHERGEALWTWLQKYPAALRTVLASPEFLRYRAWEQHFLTKESERKAKELALVGNMLQICREHWHSSVTEIKLAISPIKCAYSADFHFFNRCFVFSSGEFRAESVIHEFLHPIVHPFTKEHRAEILSADTNYPDIDRSYYLSGDADGIRNAFEEYTVRRLTADVLANRIPSDLRIYLPR